MTGLQKGGGIAALVEAAAYLTGFALFLTVLGLPDDLEPAGRIAFLVANRPGVEAAMLVTYLLTGIVTVVLSVALHERLHEGALARVAAGLGLIWGGLLLASGSVALVGLGAVADLHGHDPAAAGTLWRTVAVVRDGLGGDNEIVGGLWLLLVCEAARRSRALPRPIAYAGLGIGAVGVLTTLPVLAPLTDLFGLALIVWFAALGTIMLRPTPLPRRG